MGRESFISPSERVKHSPGRERQEEVWGSESKAHINIYTHQLERPGNGSKGVGSWDLRQRVFSCDG